MERLRQRLEAANHEKTVQESQNQNLVVQLSNKEQERTSSHFITTNTDNCCVVDSNSCSVGLEAEVARLREENSRAVVECDRLK